MTHRGANARFGAIRSTRAFTLIEVVVASAVAGILLFGLVSAVLIVGRAAPDDASPQAQVSSAASIVDEMARDIQYALTAPEWGLRVIEVTVADRDADGQPETIRYEWDGKPGGPLLKTLNGKTVEAAPTVEALAFQHDVETVTTQEPQTQTATTPEMLLASFYSWPGSIGASSAYRITSSRWILAATTLPGAPAGTTAIQFTRARFRVQNCTALTRLTAELAEVAGARQVAPVFVSLGTPVTVVPGYCGASFMWVQATFADAVAAGADGMFGLTVKGDATQPDVEYYHSTSAPVDSSVTLFTSNSGGNWQPALVQINQFGMPFELYGICTTQTTQLVDVTRYYLRNVGVTLRCSADASSEVKSRVELLNAPEVAGP